MAKYLEPTLLNGAVCLVRQMLPLEMISTFRDFEILDSYIEAKIDNISGELITCHEAPVETEKEVIKGQSFSKKKLFPSRIFRLEHGYVNGGFGTELSVMAID